MSKLMFFLACLMCVFVAWTVSEQRKEEYEEQTINLWKPEADHMQEIEYSRNLERVQQYERDVTLDPDSAHPALMLSDDGKQVKHGDVRKNLPDNPERFDKYVHVLAKQSFSSGRFYYEVQVKGKTAWELGVARESVNRKGDITASPQNGYWTIWLMNDEYYANDPGVLLSLKSRPQKVGVFVDYEEGLVSFYDVDAAALIYSFTGCSFTERLYPIFSPCTNDGGKNSAPLIISPEYSNTRIEYSRNLERVQQYDVDVTLDPDTAHPELILSDDGKQVKLGDVRKNLPDNPERFDKYVHVLAKQSFYTGRFYYEVQVKGKTAWELGVARESVNRKGDITASPQNGYWTIWLMNDEYYANEPGVLLSLWSRPQKVGVFVDYEEGLVSFYDVDAAALIYSFTGCSFTEKLYPIFSPYNNDGGKNSAPLIISPVSH